MKKVTGNLIQKRDMYYVVLNYPRVDGKRIRKTLSTGLPTKRNETKAKAIMRQMLKAANAGQEVHGVMERTSKEHKPTEDTGPRPDMYFSDYLLFWLQWKRNTWEEVTYASYHTIVASLAAPYFAEKKIRLNQLTAFDIQGYYTYMLTVRKNKGNTVVHHHANLRKALADAVKLKLIPYNPAMDVDRPKIDNFVSPYYTADELADVLALFKGTKMELPVMLAAYYGLRRSEVMGLRWQSIDFTNNCITISHKLEIARIDGEQKVITKDRTKNKASFRSLPLIPFIAELLKSKKQEQEVRRKICGKDYNRKYLDYICVDDMGNIIKPDYVTRTFHDTLVGSQMKVARFHDLRHSCASLLLANGISIKEIQVWLGHSNFSTTANIYAHLDVTCKQAAAATIAGCIQLGGHSEDDHLLSSAENKKSPKRKTA